MKKIDSTKKNLIFIFIIIVIIILLLIILETLIATNIAKKQQETADDSVWLFENCVCLENNLISCPAGFKLVGKMCLKKENSTSTLKGCSKYDCFGKIKLFDVGLQRWLNQNWQLLIG